VSELVKLEPVALPERTLSPVATYLASLESAQSRSTMRATVDRLARILTGDDQAVAEQVPWHQLTGEHTTAIRAGLIERYAPSTTRKMLSALAGVLHQSWRLGLMTREEYERARAWGKVRGQGLSGAQAGRHVETGEMRALFASCAEDPVPNRGIRDAAILAVLYGAGCRRAECVGIDVDQYDVETGALTIVGKGGKTRTAYCTGGSCDAMAAWLEVRGSEPGPFFVPVNKAGRIHPQRPRMSTTAVWQILQRRALQAGVKPLAPHDLRRTYAGDLFDAGADTAAVQRLMGHASSSVTTGYDRRGERAKVRAAEMLHVPYVARESK
jgi:site-specific recombinase XerD